MAQSIGIKALRDTLSSVIRDLEPGETVDITDRGRVVAHLVAASATNPLGFDRLAEAGALRLPQRRATPFANWPPRDREALPPGTVQSLLDAEREEKTR